MSRAIDRRSVRAAPSPGRPDRAWPPAGPLRTSRGIDDHGKRSFATAQNDGTAARGHLTIIKTLHQSLSPCLLLFVIIIFQTTKISSFASIQSCFLKIMILVLKWNKNYPILIYASDSRRKKLSHIKKVASTDNSSQYMVGVVTQVAER